MKVLQYGYILVYRCTHFTGGDFMDVTGIAALSSTMSQASVKQQAGMAVAKKTLDVAEQQGMSLVKMIEETPTAAQMKATPHLGANVDVLI